MTRFKFSTAHTLPRSALPSVPALATALVGDSTECERRADREASANRGSHVADVAGVQRTQAAERRPCAPQETT